MCFRAITQDLKVRHVTGANDTTGNGHAAAAHTQNNQVPSGEAQNAASNNQQGAVGPGVREQYPAAAVPPATAAAAAGMPAVPTHAPPVNHGPGPDLAPAAAQPQNGVIGRGPAAGTGLPSYVIGKPPADAYLFRLIAQLDQPSVPEAVSKCTS